MSIQEIALSQNQKKKLLKAIKDKSVLFEDDNGDIVLDIVVYLNLKKDQDTAPIEAILGDDVLDLTVQYIIFT